MSAGPPLLLAIDTSGEDAGLALADGDRIDVALLPRNDRGVARTEDLARQTAALLGVRGHSVSDLALLAAVVGPGSYTGLRSGLAFLRGLAFGDALPAVAVGTLELIAWRGALPGEAVIAAAPSGHGRYVVATYTRGKDTIEEQTAPQILEPADFADFLLASRGAGNVALVLSEAGGNGASTPASDSASALEAARRAAGLERRAPASDALEQLAVLAQARARRALTVRASELLPLYVGQPAARPNRHRVAIGAVTE